MEKRLSSHVPPVVSDSRNNPHTPLRHYERTTIDFSIKVGELMGARKFWTTFPYVVKWEFGRSVEEVYPKRGEQLGPFPEITKRIQVVWSQEKGLRGVDGEVLSGVLTIEKSRMLDGKLFAISSTIINISSCLLRMISENKITIEENYSFPPRIKTVVTLTMKIIGPNNLPSDIFPQYENISNHVRFRDQTSDDFFEYEVRSKSSASSYPENSAIVDSKVARQTLPTLQHVDTPYRLNPIEIDSQSSDVNSLTKSCKLAEEEIQEMDAELQSLLQLNEKERKEDENYVNSESSTDFDSILPITGNVAAFRDNTPRPRLSLSNSELRKNMSDSSSNFKLGAPRNSLEHLMISDIKINSAEGLRPLHVSKLNRIGRRGTAEVYDWDMLRKEIADKKAEIAGTLSKFIEDCFNPDIPEKVKFRHPDHLIPDKYKERLRDAARSIELQGNELHEVVLKCKNDRLADATTSPGTEDISTGTLNSSAVVADDSSQSLSNIEVKAFKLATGETTEQIKRRVYKAHNEKRPLGEQLKKKLSEMNDMVNIDMDQIRKNYDASTASLTDGYCTSQNQQVSFVKSHANAKTEWWDIRKLNTLKDTGNGKRISQLNEFPPEIINLSKLQDCLQIAIGIQLQMDSNMRQVPEWIKGIQEIATGARIWPKSFQEFTHDKVSRRIRITGDNRSDDNYSDLENTDDKETLPDGNDDIGTFSDRPGNIDANPDKKDNISAIPDKNGDIDATPGKNDNVRTIPHEDDDIDAISDENDGYCDIADEYDGVTNSIGSNEGDVDDDNPTVVDGDDNIAHVIDDNTQKGASDM